MKCQAPGSGHYWLKVDGLSLEIYYRRRKVVLWGIYKIQGEHVTDLVEHSRLDKTNIVYPSYMDTIIPEFATVRAAVTWLRTVRDRKFFTTLE